MKKKQQQQQHPLPFLYMFLFLSSYLFICRVCERNHDLLGCMHQFIKLNLPWLYLDLFILEANKLIHQEVSVWIFFGYSFVHIMLSDFTCGLTILHIWTRKKKSFND